MDESDSIYVSDLISFGGTRFLRCEHSTIITTIIYNNNNNYYYSGNPHLIIVSRYIGKNTGGDRENQASLSGNSDFQGKSRYRFTSIEMVDIVVIVYV